MDLLEMIRLNLSSSNCKVIEKCAGSTASTSFLSGRNSFNKAGGFVECAHRVLLGWVPASLK